MCRLNVADFIKAELACQKRSSYSMQKPEHKFGQVYDEHFDMCLKHTRINKQNEITLTIDLHICQRKETHF